MSHGRAATGLTAAARLVLAAVTASAVAVPSARAAFPVGFRQEAVPVAGSAPLPLAVWYPTEATPHPSTLLLFDQDVATGAAPAPGSFPLVVMSHGSGLNEASNLDTALALAAAGFVVAAPTHAGDNFRDHSRSLALWHRPPEIVATIDYLLLNWPGRAAIDPARIGMFGFSAGGFTTLVLIGGRPDYRRIDPFCARHAGTVLCRLVRANHLEGAPPPGASVWVSDPRIRAAVIAAPALGFTFGRDGLAAVHVPVQLWGAADDDVLPVAFNADAVRDDLPSPPEFHLVADAAHTDFVAPCTEAVARVAPAACAEPDGLDRAAFHRSFDAAVVRFFRDHLGEAHP